MSWRWARPPPLTRPHKSLRPGARKRGPGGAGTLTARVDPGAICFRRLTRTNQEPIKPGTINRRLSQF